MIDFGLGNGRLALVGAVLVAVMLAVPLGRAYARRLKRLVAFATGQATARVIAHEIGHAFRCADVYHAKKHDAGVHIPDSIVCENHEPMDWSNGTGCRYYPVGVDQESIIKRLLMCGNAYPSSVDISAGSVYGFTEYDDDGQVDVGFFRSGVRRRVHYHR